MQNSYRQSQMGNMGILNPDQNPNNSMSCIGDICCHTESYTSDQGRTVYVTVCWNTRSGKLLSSKILDSINM